VYCNIDGATVYFDGTPAGTTAGGILSVAVAVAGTPVQTGSIYAQSSPGGAAIYLNGNFRGYAPLTIPNLAPGAYSIKAVLSGYTPDILTVSVYAGSNTPYYPNLQPSPPPAPARPGRSWCPPSRALRSSLLTEITREKPAHHHPVRREPYGQALAPGVP
jgi:hypothetical protein